MRISAFCAASLLALSWCAAQAFDFKGPYGGDVRSIAINPYIPNVLLVGTSDGQIFRSDDSGKRWERIAGLGLGAVVDNLVFDPSMEGRVYAAVWDSKSNHGGNLLRSENSGTSWTDLPITPRGVSIRAFAVAPNDSNTLLVGALDGVYVSRDEGRAWKLISRDEPGLVNVESVAIDPKDANIFYAGTWHLGAKTTNGGKTWTWMKQGMANDSDLFAIRIHPVKSEVIYASACSGVYKSANAGRLWVKLNNGLPAEARRARTIYIDPVNHDRLFTGTTQGLFLSEDAGHSWKRISSSDLTIHAVAVNPRNAEEVYLATDDAGILKSDDGAKTFQPSNEGFTHRQIAQVVVDPQDQERLYASVLFDRAYGGFFISDDGGRKWRQSNQGISVADTDVYCILPSTQDRDVYIGTSSGIYLSKDRGENWRKLAAPPRSSRLFSKIFQSKVLQLQYLASMERSIAAATLDGLYLGDLETGQWTRITFSQYNGAITALLVDVATNSLFAASNIGVFISRDVGKTWRLRGDGLPITPIRVLERFPQEKVILVGTSSGLYRSVDDGETWNKVTRGIPPVDISALHKAKDGKSIYAGDFLQGNVYASYDLGANWQVLIPGVNSGVSSIMVDPRNDGTLFLGSLSDGIASFSLRPPANTSVAQRR
ncbi:MAG: hypothetical protein HY644_05775 [Acidobacteria bacterium]|nr:hypothetical protein [Acidobacteriota bacterium]